VSVGDGTYPLRYPLRLYTVADPEDELQHFLRFLYLHDGPGLVAAAGLVPVQSFAAMTRSAAGARERAQVSMTRIEFGFRGARLDADARRDLTEIASLLAGGEEGVWITGHEEPTEARDELAATRSRAVADFLQGQNIDPSRMTIDSRGTSEPIASNDELEGRRSNRRVDVWILRH
jgi:outer membrane protein OmpA-like peptidoglycan-associated protein